MPNSTPNSEKTTDIAKKRCKQAVSKLKNVKKSLKPSADAIFFVRLFARACQPVC